MNKSRVFFPTILFCFLILALIYYFVFTPSRPVDNLVLSQTRFSKLEGWNNDNLIEAFKAFKHSCKKIVRQPDEKSMGGKLISSTGIEPIAGKVGDWKYICKDALSADIQEHNSSKLFFQKWFFPFAISNGKSDSIFFRGDDLGLFTGYYEPLVKGSMKKNHQYNVPLYEFPEHYIKVDLNNFYPKLNYKHIVGKIVDSKLMPADTRKEIDKGALENKTKVLVWLKNPIDSFFLHIQGSGVIELPNGKKFRVGYAGSNGYKYYPIGRKLLELGEVSREKMSMQEIRKWLELNPKKINSLFNKNERYIFFQEIKSDFTLGSFGVPLTPGRSLAIDKQWIAMGVPLWISAAQTKDYSKDFNYNRLMITQDTGSAIKGIVRGDIFYGNGKMAEKLAGRTSHLGRYYIFLPRKLIQNRLKAYSNEKK